MASRKFSVRIRWGADPEGRKKIFTYSFSTRNELKSFLWGVSEADGWMDFDILSADTKALTIEWGESLRETVTYLFGSGAQRRAFIRGADEMVGESKYEVVD